MAARKAAALRRRRRLIGRVGFGLGGVVAVAGAAVAIWLLRPPPDRLAEAGPAAGSSAAPEGAAATAPADAAPPAAGPVETAAGAAPLPDEEDILAGFINLPGDPMRLVVAPRAAAGTQQLLDRPAALDAGEDRGDGAVRAIRDAMLSPGERVVTALPSSREDFAVFQAQRRGLVERARPRPDTAQDSAEAAPDPMAPVATASAAAALIARLTAQPPADGPRLASRRLALAAPDRRRAVHEDAVLRVTATTPIDDLLRIEGLPAAEAGAVATAAEVHLGRDRLEPGQVLVLRRLPPAAGSGPRFAQLALYTETQRLGVLARVGEGSAGPLVMPATRDPWAEADHFALAGTPPAAAPGSQRVRVLDALYATAMRHRLPSGLVGELIMMLAEAHDLEAEARIGDRLTLLLSSEPPAGGGLGQILFVAVEGAEVQLRCYLYRPRSDQPHTCYGSGPRRGAGATAGSATAPAGGLTEGAAVEQLIERIIQIESAGRPDAKNPRSTATGLGQFIESTWLRMMRTYRPDLVAAHSREELLEMRTQPDISREMVFNLAREGETFLRARGHQITAGRLYLAHFLGMEGAHLVLSSPMTADLLELLGAGVIRANDFLTDRDVAWIIDWAERRMRTRAGAIAVVREPQGLAAFRDAVDALLGEG